MSSNERWLLPEGVDEILPEEAERLEQMRRALLDLFRGWGYELVMPPMIEYLDSLLTGLGQDLDLQTFKITDQLTGRLMGVRADMTPQVARIEAHYMRRKGPVRLCYLGSVLRTRPDEFGGSREPLQVGAELFGHAGPQSDVEIIQLMVEALKLCDIQGLSLDLGHVGVFRALVEYCELPAQYEAPLFEALRRKAQPDLEALLNTAGVSGPCTEMFAALAQLNGGREVLDRARAAFAPAADTVAAALENLAQVAAGVEAVMPGLALYFDLAELRGYRYHTGVVFSVFADGYGQEIAKGGRYDNIGKAFGYARPATGFSADLRTLARLAPSPAAVARCILAPGDADAALEQEIARLRRNGERVVRALPGADAAETASSCDRRLVKRDGRWRIEPLARAGRRGR